MQPSPANPAPEEAAPRTEKEPLPAKPTPGLPPWQQAWTGAAQWTVCVLLAVTVLVLALRGLLDWHAGPRQPYLDWSYRLDLNRARAPELTQVPGIGPQLADRIVEYQQTHGGFQQVDDLRQVPGIGPATLERLRPWVYVSHQPPPATSPIPPKPLAKAPKKSKKAEAFTGPPIDINSASAAELQKLPGIGPKMSQRIIDERVKKSFASVEELRRVSGIGPKTLEKLRPFVTASGDKGPLTVTSSYNEEK